MFRDGVIIAKIETSANIAFRVSRGFSTRGIKLSLGSMWYAGGSEAEQLAHSFGSGLAPWLIATVPGVLSYEAHRAGKIALGAEWGGGARLDPAGVAGYTAGLR